MKATIRVGDDVATLEDWEWTGEDIIFTQMLNSMLDPLGPSGSDPAPNTHEAERVAELLGGEVVGYEIPVYASGRIY